MILWCTKCDGSGEWGTDECDACDGSGNARCEARGCKEDAVGCDEDGRALCEDCLSEWATNYGALGEVE